MNKVILVGALGQDPEVKTTNSGKTIARCSLATNNSKDKPPTWHRLVMWNKTAEFAGTYLKKGSSVAVEGRIDNRSWETDDGTKKYVSEIIVDRIEFVGKKEKEKEAPSDLAEQHGVKNLAPTFDNNEEVPF